MSLWTAIVHCSMSMGTSWAVGLESVFEEATVGILLRVICCRQMFKNFAALQTYKVFAHHFK